MAADLTAVAQSFVTALAADAAARDAFAAAMHPPDADKAAAVVNQYAGADQPISAADLSQLVPLIGKLLGDARAGGASSISGSIMPGDLGGATASIMRGDAEGASGSIMPADAGGSSGSIMPGDKEPEK